jgi:prolipoprotein diacylglyceryl transferase
VTPTTLLASIPSPSSSVLHLGPLQIRYYGLCIAVGVVVGVKVIADRWEWRGGDVNLVSTVAVWAVPFGLVGARLYHLATDWGTYAGRRWDMLAIWKGGLGIWGGVALGTAVGAWVCHRHGGPVLVLMDMAAPGIAVAQACGRWGNWFNQELFGRPTGMPWGLRIDSDHCPSNYNPCAGLRFHPTFLYESLWCLAVAAFVVFVFEGRLRPGRVKPGQSFALYVALYTLGRWYFESLRIDPAFTHVGGVRINEVVAPAVMVVAAVAFVLLGRRAVEPDPTPQHPLAPGTPGAVAATESTESTEPTEPTEPSESREATEPTEPTDATEVADAGGDVGDEAGGEPAVVPGDTSTAPATATESRPDETGRG